MVNEWFIASCLPRLRRRGRLAECARVILHLACGAVRGMLAEMDRQVGVVLYAVAMAAIIVGVDFAFLRNRFWERLIVNIGIVLVFAAFYLLFLRRP